MYDCYYVAPTGRVIDLTCENVVECVSKETGGLGVSCILDFQDVSLLAPEKSSETPTESESDDTKQSVLPEPKFALPVVGKHDIVRCLGVHGRWCSSSADIQLDPPDSRQLFMRGATLSYLFPQTWLLAPQYHGKYMHILSDLLENTSRGILKPHIRPTRFTLDKIRQAHREMASPGVGKVVLRES
jgi:Zinc-binding dehydrogenase